MTSLCRHENPRVRLNAYLARAGVASRRGADELIKAGRVRVNGEPGQLNTFVEAGDAVELDGTAARAAAARLRAAAQAGRRRHDRARPARAARPSSSLVPREPRVVPVGRLDADTTGALLLTNDGPLAHRLAHPRYEVEKVYEAEVEGEPDRGRARAAREGVELDDGPTAPATRSRLGPHLVELTLHEGRKHQVKRMLEAVGHPVLRLHRSRYAGLTLERPGSRASGASSPTAKRQRP